MINLSLYSICFVESISKYSKLEVGTWVYGFLMFGLFNQFNKFLIDIMHEKQKYQSLNWCWNERTETLIQFRKLFSNGIEINSKLYHNSRKTGIHSISHFNDATLPNGIQVNIFFE